MTPNREVFTFEFRRPDPERATRRTNTVSATFPQLER